MKKWVQSVLVFVLLILAVVCALESGFSITESRAEPEYWAHPEAGTKVSVLVSSFLYGAASLVAIGVVVTNRAYIMQGLLGLFLSGRAFWGGRHLNSSPVDKHWGDDQVGAWLYHVGIAFLALGIVCALSMALRGRRWGESGGE